MERISFNFKELKDIRPALWELRCRVGSRDNAVTSNHLAPLDELATSLNATLHARKNAKRLATGYRDLVVLLLEPSNNAENAPYDKMRADSVALQHVDDSLRFAFDGQRNLDNTIVLDIRPFRSATIRMQQQNEERDVDDEQAYSAIEKVSNFLKPEAVLVCQCQTSKVQNSLVREFCSSIETNGDIELHVLQNGHELVKINCFHPMFVERTKKYENPFKRIVREYLFDATFIVAANFLAGRKLSGFGLSNLRKCVMDGPAMRFTSEGVRISYQWMDEDDIASPSLTKMLEKLGLGSMDERFTKLDKLFGLNRRICIQHDEIVHLSDEDQKEDVFKEIGHLIAELPNGLVPFDHVRVEASPQRSVGIEVAMWLLGSCPCLIVQPKFLHVSRSI